jgi:hypothetical protein
MLFDIILVAYEPHLWCYIYVLDSSASDRWFEPLSGQTKVCNIEICFFPFKHAV